MPKYRMLLQYAGTRYAGWQVQRRQPTIQGCLQDALAQMTRQRVSVVSAGRTDAGVHARGQVAHFRLQAAWPVDRLQRALNAVLPWDIRVMRLISVSEAFHAQRDALRKRYEYHVYTGPTVSPFRHGYVLHWRRKLDHESMAGAARLVLGEQDFSGFAAAASRVRNSRRRVFLSEVRRTGSRLVYRIEANGFLHHMVRNIVGTLLEVGRGRRPAADIKRILESGDRREAGPTAPPQGLFLVKVWYHQ